MVKKNQLEQLINLALWAKIRGNYFRGNKNPVLPLTETFKMINFCSKNLQQPSSKDLILSFSQLLRDKQEVIKNSLILIWIKRDQFRSLNFLRTESWMKDLFFLKVSSKRHCLIKKLVLFLRRLITNKTLSKNHLLEHLETHKPILSTSHN
jgi:hypothetical protein